MAEVKQAKQQEEPRNEFVLPASATCPMFCLKLAQIACNMLLPLIQVLESLRSMAAETPKPFKPSLQCLGATTVTLNPQP